MPKRSVPGRRPDPNYRPREKKVIVVGPVPMYHGLWNVLVPGDGEVKIFEKRFPVAGEVSKASLRLRNVPADAEISVRLSLEGEDIVTHKLEGEDVILKDLPTLPVDEEVMVRVHLVRTQQGAPITVDANIAYMFQEKLRASVQLKT